jgi:hypothetical protein
MVTRFFLGRPRCGEGRNPSDSLKDSLKSSRWRAVQSLVSDDATFIRILVGLLHGSAGMMVIPPTIGVILVLIGIVLFIVDLGVTNHGLPTAGGIIALLAGGLALLGAGVPYSGVLLGAIVVVAMLMGGMNAKNMRKASAAAYISMSS